MEFRIATHADIQQIVDLVNLSYRSHEFQGWTSEANIVAGDRINDEQVKILIDENPQLFVIFDHDELIGCVHIQQKDSCYISMLTMHPKVQNKGIGKRILKFAEEYAIKYYSIYTFDISVLSVRKELIHFYERRGYQSTGQVEEYPVNANVGMPLSSDLKVFHLRKVLSRIKN